MKKLSIFLFAMFAFSVFTFGQLRFGAGASLGLDVYEKTRFGIQGKALYNVNEMFKGSGTFTYFFESSNTNVWTLDFDVHYKLMKIGDGIELNPFAGIEYANFSVSAGGFGASASDIGINLGASFIIPAGESLTIYAEPKLVLDALGGIVLTAGVLY